MPLDLGWPILWAGATVSSRKAKPMSLGEAMDLVGSIRNRCSIAQMIYPEAGCSLMYTLFEDIAEDALQLMEFCIDEKAGE